MIDGVVAPFTGAWIETHLARRFWRLERSHPSRVRGLKREVALVLRRPSGRTLHGCVD